MKALIIIFTTGLYAGYSPIASGTAGSAVGVLLYLLILSLGPAAYGIFVIALFIAGVWASSKAEAIFGEKDSGKIVIDEICGMIITMFTVPFSWMHLIIGFLLFRILDIIKPFRGVEDLKGGWGVMLDDIIAGTISNIILQASIFFLKV